MTRLEIENFNQQNEIENGIETSQNLQSELETLRDELQFNNHKIDEYEKLLQGERHRIRELEQELQVRESQRENTEFGTETQIYDDLIAEYKRETALSDRNKYQPHGSAGQEGGLLIRNKE